MVDVQPPPDDDVVRAPNPLLNEHSRVKDFSALVLEGQTGVQKTDVRKPFVEVVVDTEAKETKLKNVDNCEETSRTIAPSRSELWTKLESLKTLLDEGYITYEEYQQRKISLVDHLTGTKTETQTATVAVKEKSRKQGLPKPTTRGKLTKNKKSPKVLEEEKLPPRKPPNFSEIPDETAIKHTFDPVSRSWTKRTVQIKIDIQPFARGGLRNAFYLVELTESTMDELFVAKTSIDPTEERESYFHDVELQIYAQEWAEKFNLCDPPKKVEFIAAWILELIERESSPVCAVEKYISGPYRKHNNNFGYVSEEERNTPQAFSHFTYETSNHTVLICDIQGVGDLYTDPQMHTAGKGLGRGDLGTKGMTKFIQAHRCNRICHYLGLPSINSKEDDAGTIPATPHMRKEICSSLSSPVLYPRAQRNLQQPKFKDQTQTPTPLLYSASSPACVQDKQLQKNPLMAAESNNLLSRPLVNQSLKQEGRCNCFCSIL